MPIATLENDLRIFYEDSGSGEPVILVHGFGMSHSVWDQIRIQLSKDYRVIALDLRGHGSSDKPIEGYNIETFSDDIHCLIMQLGLRNSVYVGWSLGVAIGLRLSAKYAGDLSKIVLVGGTPCWARLPDFEHGHPIQLVNSWIQELRKDRPEWIEKFVLSMFKDEPDEKTTKWLCSIAEQLPLRAAIEIIHDSSSSDLRKDVKRITQRTAIFHGLNDKMDYIEAGEYMVRMIPNSKFVIFNKSGHVPFLEEKEKFLTELLIFISEKEPLKMAK
jgi:non-heme chloroperoxidase